MPSDTITVARDLQAGLTREQADQALEKFGPNATPSTARHPLFARFEIA